MPNATIVARHDLTPAVARFTIRPDEGPTAFRPGQYLAVGMDIEGRFVQRPYSSASPAGSRDHEFLVRHVASGAFTPHLWRLAIGDRVRLGRPKGIFTLIDDDPRTHLFMATGTGLAPFMSMLEAIGSRPLPPRSIVLHGVAHVGELAYRDRLEGRASDGLAYVPVVSRPGAPGNEGWTGHTGHIGEALHDLFVRGIVQPAGTVAYLCGNPAMVISATRVLADAGFPAQAIRSEQYWSSGTGAERPASAA
jgi:ferredoxin--NADP+ reductase